MKKQPMRCLSTYSLSTCGFWIFSNEYKTLFFKFSNLLLTLHVLCVDGTLDRKKNIWALCTPKWPISTPFLISEEQERFRKFTSEYSFLFFYLYYSIFHYRDDRHSVTFRSLFFSKSTSFSSLSMMNVSDIEHLPPNTDPSFSVSISLRYPSMTSFTVPS